MAIAQAHSPFPDKRGTSHTSQAFLLPILLLVIVYGLLGLTFTAQPTHVALMQRCVLMDPTMSRIWSVANIELGLGYLGIFAAMVFYIHQASATDRTHLRDLGYAFAYLAATFALDIFCVMHFQPLQALLIGDAIVMTFTLLVSRQLWFQRLLGVFVPLIFLTCGIGHSMEGLSFWTETFHWNVPWTMVTADIGFAVLVNSARFPGFIRGFDIAEELAAVRRQSEERNLFLRDVLRVATENRLYFCVNSSELPDILPNVAHATIPIRSLDDVPLARRTATTQARDLGFGEEVANRTASIVGEAAMNAVQHGGGGELGLSYNQEQYQIRIQDRGAGIPLAILPRAVLEAGFSSDTTAGYGFTMMLNQAHRTDMFTGPDGTTLVFTLRRSSA